MRCCGTARLRAGGVLSVFTIAKFCALVCSAMRPGDFVPTLYLPVLVLNCDYWIAWSYVRGSVRCCVLLVAMPCHAMPCHAMPRAFLSCWSSVRYVLVSYGCVAPGVCAARVGCAVCCSAPASLIQPGVPLC